MLSDKLLEIRHLEKSFGSFKAVNDISLHVNKGDIYGFLGPNGAGKSTTLRMVLGLIKPNKGEILIMQLEVCVEDEPLLDLLYR